ncbi:MULTISPECIES: hypothetical protein [Halomonadaceae]|nr:MULTISPECIES: hypothetical protein [Halomonas]
MQDEPNLVDSPLNERLEVEGHTFTVGIYRLETEIASLDAGNS